MLDQVFVEVFPGGLAAGMLTGLVACSVVAGCQEVGAYDRAAEWTALSAWCDEQPELVQFSAECLVHRAEVLLRRGYWPGSLAEAGAAARCAERDGVAATAAAAAYGRGEALRLLGRTDEAERAYQDARHGGHDPMPGLARLRLQQDRGTAALSGLRRVLAMTDDPLRRAAFLAFGLPSLRRFVPPQLARAVAAYLAIAWLLMSWYPHGGLHASNGMDTGPLLWIEYGFHVPLVVAPLVLIWAVAGRRPAHVPVNPESVTAGVSLDRGLQR